MKTYDIYESLEYELESISNQLDEENVTANIDGYQSPNIFTKKPPRDSDIKKKKSNMFEFNEDLKRIRKFLRISNTMNFFSKKSI